jgi:hypothetical protein
MNGPEICLFPRPQKLTTFSDRFPIPSTFPFYIEDNSFQILETHLLSHGFSSVGQVSEALILIQKEKSSHPEAYNLKITPSQIIISGNEAVGIFHGLQTLFQILGNQEYVQNLPCLEIEDYPLLERRGFMLDVSRCKVPKMDTLYSLIDLLAQLHINEFQLYIEHTFAFQEHETVWKDSSPFTAQEIQLIDRYCKERFIELVPNLNSFGHFERWLRHDQYKHLAECPDGFRRENPYILRDHGTTLKPNQESLDFINSLYSEYLPNFSSKKFNVGMDEPWELGQGWSKNKIEKEGKDQVYLSHLEGIRLLVESHGKEMQFWADVLLENPENAKRLPLSASPIIWGYEPSHPFDQQANAIASCGLSYCLAPGTGTWRSFSGRWENTCENIDSAITHAQKHNAQGVLLTSWGDCGNHQPWATLYPPLLYGAAKAWNNQSIDEREVIDGIGKLVCGNQSKDDHSAMIELGKLDRFLGSDIPNTSLCWHLLFAPLPDKLVAHIRQNHTTEQFKEGISLLQSIQQSISIRSTHSKSKLIEEEVSLGIKLSTIALEKGIALLEGNQVPKLHQENELFSTYEELWLVRARPGGLSESIELLKESIAQP